MQFVAARLQFRQLLDTMRTNSTVVTVWTHADSFGEFRELKSGFDDRNGSIHD